MRSTFPLQFARYHEIAARVAGHLLSGRGTDPLAPWGDEVLVASQGMGEAISAELLRARPEGVAAIRLQSVETLARRILNARGELPRVANDAERRLAMRAAVRAVKDTVTQSRGIASMLERSYRDLRDSNLTLADFTRRAERLRLRHPERIRAVARVWSEYERLISLLGATDPADLIRRASRALREAAVKGPEALEGIAPQIVAGFYDMTGVQLDFLESLRIAGRLAAVYVPAGSGEPYRFANALVAQLAPHADTPAEPLLQISRPEATIELHERRAIEIEHVCARVAGLLADGVPPSAIGIVARSLDDYDIHLFNRSAAAAGFRTTRDEEIPLIAHRVGRTVAAVLRLREDNFVRGEVIEVLRGGIRVSKRLDVDAVDVETRARRIAGGTSDELKKNARSALTDDYVEAVKELERLTKPLEETALRGSAWSALLTAITERLALTSESDLGAAAAIDAIAALFARADAPDVRFDVTQVIEAIEHAAIPSVAQPFEADPRPEGGSEPPSVWLGDVMKMRGRTFEHLFVVHMQEEAFPQRRVEDPLLPDTDRRELGIRIVGDGRAEEEILFQLLFDAARGSIRFSFSASDGFGKALRPSQFLKNFAIERYPERKGELLRDFAGALSGVNGPKAAAKAAGLQSGGKPPHSKRPLQLIARAGTNSVFDGFFSDPLLLAYFAKRLEAVSPTQLEDFGECPQKFLVRHILRAKELEDPERELQINARDKGSADHRILERFYRSMSTDDRSAASAQLPRLPDGLAARLERAIDEEFASLQETAPPFNPSIREIELRATRRILRDFVVRDLIDSTESGLVPQYFEYRFGASRRHGEPDRPEPFVITAGTIPIRIEGQIDRVDTDGKKYRVIDYKSGKALRHTKLAEKIDRGVRFQLAAYAMAVAGFFGIDDADVSAAIKAIAATDSKSEKNLSFELAEKRDVIRATLDTFVTAIVKGRFPAFPEKRDFDSCKYCPVSHSCRTRHEAAEAYAVTRHREPVTLLRSVEESS